MRAQDLPPFILGLTLCLVGAVLVAEIARESPQGQIIGVVLFLVGLLSLGLGYYFREW